MSTSILRLSFCVFLLAGLAGCGSSVNCGSCGGGGSTTVTYTITGPAPTAITVPVDVDAVLFWKVIDPKKAALDVADYVSAINWASQTALRDVIGNTLAFGHAAEPEKISRTRPGKIDAGPRAVDHMLFRRTKECDSSSS